MSDWQPGADDNASAGQSSGCTVAALKARAKLNQQVRAFFSERGVLEVETPALSQGGNTDPYIDSFSVETPTGLRYLHTSPEYPMKRLLVAGSGDIYQVCKVWRQDESGSRHNPEFTLLEYYRIGFSYQRLMQEVALLLHTLLPRLDKPAQFLTYQHCFLERLGINPHIASEEQLKNCASGQGLNISGSFNRQEWLDLLFTHVIEAGFATDRLTFVYHYPAAQSALACVTEHQGHQVAERFEIYLGAMELGNGYQELIDGEANAGKLEQDAQLRTKTGLKPVTTDQRFIQAMQQGMPRASGVAIGLDRVLLCAQDKKTLNQVISFSWELA
ncbi:MAG: Translation elongation factor P Lys34:lysine transferase [uncultured Thiotrichaceae bacterium]|uniref:Translation elongation factor P Lys34:lysine transferase n=1 Tax=uncultured Thiotrichaceae bacterium TaxID=298394 RepID=A0A6S6SKW9_9GAMM|nr:MAG: Translation elongation factor P Lys34:lysine transferase [uncultured Thiotrichaceae bacterium]